MHQPETANIGLPLRRSVWLLLAGAVISGCQATGETTTRPMVATTSVVGTSPVATAPEDTDGDSRLLKVGPFASDASSPVGRQLKDRPTIPLVAQVVFDEPVVTPAAEIEGLHPPSARTRVAELSDVAVSNSQHSTGLTLADVESLAISAHPALAEARSRVTAAHGQYIQAGLPFNPVLQYRSDEIGNEGSSGLHSLNLSQQFVTADKLCLAQKVQAQQVAKRRAQIRLARLRVLTRVRAAFARTLIAQSRLELAKQIAQVAEKSQESVETLLRAKEVSRVELLQSRVEAQRAQIRVENTATQLAASQRVLAAATGVGTLPSGRLVGNIADGFTDRPWEALIAEIMAASPELSFAGSELERAKWALQLACAQVTPNITGQVGVGIDDSTSDTFASVGLSVPLPIRNRNQGNIRTARANIAAAAANVERTRLSLEVRLADAFARYQTGRQRYYRMIDEVLPDAEETFGLAQAAFGAGETSFLQLLTAQRTLFATRLSTLDTAAEARKAAAEIEGLLVATQLR